MYILLVEDKTDSFCRIAEILKSPELIITRTASENEALKLISNYDFALVIIDVQMPETKGFKTAEQIRRNEDTVNVPIIFVTSLNKNAKNILQGHETGVVDYFYNQFDPVILKSKVNLFLKLHLQKKALNKQLPCLKKKEPAEFFPSMSQEPFTVALCKMPKISFHR